MAKKKVRDVFESTLRPDRINPKWSRLEEVILANCTGFRAGDKVRVTIQLIERKRRAVRQGASK